MVRVSVTHSAIALCATFFILTVTSSVINCCTDALQHGIYLIICISLKTSTGRRQSTKLLTTMAKELNCAVVVRTGVEHFKGSTPKVCGSGSWIRRSYISLHYAFPCTGHRPLAPTLQARTYLAVNINVTRSS